ncbi:MAG: AMP-binding protein, partial [Prevotellaceae bacterium]|nr:AMP-binding protein [Prevotellaceae bacterium]
MEQSFIAYIENSVKANWDLDALTDYNGATLQYKDLARKIEKVHIVFENSGIEKGDKVAICGRNSAHWGVTFLATLTYGAVAVPILHEFKADNVHNIVNHSEAKMLFVGDQVWENLNESAMPLLEGIMLMTDFSVLVSRSEKITYAREHLNELFGKKYPKNFRREHVAYHKDKPEELALINYTSGTTSYSKGVMLPYRSLWSNTAFAFEVLPLVAGDKVISMLPMAHMYGMAFEFLYEVACGCRIFFLTRTPSPKIIFQAFAEVKPRIVVAVPLIIEKIIKKNVLPKLEKPTMKLLMKMPYINDKIKSTVCRQVIQAFGGNFEEIIIGGAAFNQEVEEFLHKIEFPYTVGYGMTECAPIICYEDWKYFKQGSCGKAAPRMEVRIDSPDPENVPGEIVCRGPNVMLGYYKNEEATREAIDADGWLHTGDLALMDADGNVTIKGRSKNMLLGGNGQNIYPEEIEDKLNNLPYVSESIIVQQNER